MKIVPVNEESKPAYLHSIEDHGGFFIIHLQGDLDMHALEDNREKMTKVIEDNGIYEKSILCDFSRVAHCDTATVAGLVTRLSEFRKRGGRKLIFYNITGELCALFQITHLEELFTVCKSQEEAVAALKNPQKTIR